eukprot:1687512-Pyramimonas_sp.AAC.1
MSGMYNQLSVARAPLRVPSSRTSHPSGGPWLISNSNHWPTTGRGSRWPAGRGGGAREWGRDCLLYTSPSPRDRSLS